MIAGKMTARQLALIIKVCEQCEGGRDRDRGSREWVSARMQRRMKAIFQSRGGNRLRANWFYRLLTISLVSYAWKIDNI